jgi:hypothetical protein
MLAALACLAGMCPEQERDTSPTPSGDYRILINRDSTASPALKYAIDDLRRTADWALRLPADTFSVRVLPRSEGLPTVSIVRALPFPEDGPKAVPPHGYSICSQSSGRTLVVGNGEPALIRGVYRLIEHLRMDRAALGTINETRAPAFTHRLLSHSASVYKYDKMPRLDSELDALFQTAVAGGYNFVVGHGNVSRSATFAAVDAGLLPPGSRGRQRTEANRAYLERFCRRARAFGLMPVVGGDEFEYPSELTTRPYFPDLTEHGFEREQLGATFGTGRIFCYARPELWRLHDAKYAELLDAVPEIGAVMIRLGENYTHLSHGAYIGNGVYALDNSRLCELCRSIPYEARIARLINRTADVVCREGKRLYFHRTWDTRFDRFHASPAVYDEIVRRIKPTEGLFLLTKYTISDFWRRSALNPTLGRPGPPRIVEFQCAREYEGKGAYPNWLGREYATGYRAVRDRGAAGVSNWHLGGGWDGPVASSQLWNDANWYLVDHLAWEPDAEPEVLAREWATIRFGPRAAEQMTQLLILSEQAVETLRYFQCYGPTDRRPLAMHDWMRDDIIRGRNWLSRVAADHPDRLDALIHEKNEAADMIGRMRRLATAVERDIANYEAPPRLSFEPPLPRGPALAGFVTTSLVYEQTLAATIRDLVTAYFLFLQWQDDPAVVPDKRIRRAADRWEQNWQSHRRLRESSARVASPYRDEGMERTIAYVRECLDRGPDVRFDWRVIGPFPNPDNRNFETPLFPEPGARCDLRAEHDCHRYRWQSLPRRCYRDGFVDFDALYDRRNWAVAYARARFECDTDQEAWLRIGSDDGIKVWLNDRLVHAVDRARPAVPDEDAVLVRLQHGTNTMLVKSAERILGWGFYLRITDPVGRPLQTLRPTQRPPTD